MKNKSSLGLHECMLKATIRGEFPGIIINSEDTMKKVAFAASEYSENYIDALRENNIETVVTLDVAEALKCDGLLLPGGGDIDPVYFNEEMNGANEPDKALDKAQFALLDAFVKAGKPVLGICRGLQLINVYFGGSLYQDLENKEGHMDKNNKDNVHTVTVSFEGNIFEKLYGKSFFINSSHHQGIKRVGDELREVLRSQDGVCEAVVHDSLPIIATQFHPERMSYKLKREDTVNGEDIFKYFKELL